VTFFSFLSLSFFSFCHFLHAVSSQRNATGCLFLIAHCPLRDPRWNRASRVSRYGRYGHYGSSGTRIPLFPFDWLSNVPFGSRSLARWRASRLWRFGVPRAAAVNPLFPFSLAPEIRGRGNTAHASASAFLQKRPKLQLVPLRRSRPIGVLSDLKSRQSAPDARADYSAVPRASPECRSTNRMNGRVHSRASKKKRSKERKT